MHHVLKNLFVRRAAFTTLAVSLWFALPPAMLAQKTAPATPVNTATGEPAVPRFSLEIKNGKIVDSSVSGPATIGGVLDYIKKISGEMDVVLAPHVAEVPVGDLTMHWYADNFERLAEALQAATNDKVVWISHDGGWWEVAFRPAPQPEVQVFNLNGYLRPDGDEDEKTVQTKLDSTLKIITETLRPLNKGASADDQATFQFHAGAGLLVVTGSPQALDVTRKVILALNANASNPLESTLANLVGRWTGADSTLGNLNTLGRSDASTLTTNTIRSAASVRSYRVQEGDTLSVLARKFGVTPEALTSANPNINFRSLRPGQQINIPVRQAQNMSSGGSAGSSDPFNQDFPSSETTSAVRTGSSSSTSGINQTGGGSSSSTTSPRF
jgi:LysM repeat protein